MSSPLNDLLVAHGFDPLVPLSSIEPSFSVMVRTQGNRPQSLAETLESLAAQTHPNAETLLIVHGDDTMLEAVKSNLHRGAQPAQLRLLNVQGGCEGRPLNLGIDHAVGDYVCMLDDDDLASADWLAAFARGIAASPGRIIRAVTNCQGWTTEGGTEPLRAITEIEQPFAAEFDFLAHLHHNETPNCSLAFPRVAVQRLGLRFDETLPVYDDWDFLMRAAMIIGVTSIPDATSLYRRLDSGNSFSRVDADVWKQTYEAVLERLSSLPLLLPAGAAQRVAAAEFQPGGGTAQASGGSVQADDHSTPPIRDEIRDVSRRAQALSKRIVRGTKRRVHKRIRQR